MLLLFVPFRCHIVLMLRVICFCPLHLSSTPDFSFHEPRIKIALSVMQPLWSSECEISCHCDRLYMYCYRLLWSSMSRELVLSGAVLSCHILLCQFNVFYKLSHCLLSLSCMMSLQFFWSPPHTHIPEHSLHSHTATHLDTQTHTHHFHDTL